MDLLEVTRAEVQEVLSRYLPQTRYAAAGTGDELSVEMLLGAAQDER